MKSALPFLTLAIFFASCTAAYKSSQTPDDVYFSPARPRVAQDEYVRTEDRRDKYNNYDEQTEDDRYLRMKVHNRRTWSDLDYYYSDPYAYNYSNRYNNYNSLYYNTPWNYYSSWNYYYNPYSNYYNYNNYNPYYNRYGGKVVVINQRPPVYNRPRTFNLNVYNPPQNTNARGSGSRKVYNGDNSGYNYNSGNNNSNRNSGGRLRNIFSNNNTSSSTNNSSNNNSYNNTPSRSERPSSSSAPSASPSRSSGSTNAPVRKF